MKKHSECWKGPYGCCGELYADLIQFVLELIQNTDDEDYDEQENPFFRFVRTREYLLVQYNEAGFSEEDVRSLCDISRSTKSKAASQIGEKGIGFKSVFCVSDNPQVYSGGYSFGFRSRKEDKELGYVVPYWIDQPLPCVQPNLTNVFLPVREGAQDIISRIADLHPSVLLFLKKLKTLEIIDEVAGRTRRVTRIDKGDNVELWEDNRAATWKVVRMPLAVSLNCPDERRGGLERTEVAMAFPLTPEGGADASTTPSLHAFLPVRPYGFRFVVQADFVLSSSREEILADRPWNRWLRDQIPPLFLRAVTTFKQDVHLRKQFLAYTPVAEDMKTGFFESIPGQILEELKRDNCILTHQAVGRR